MKTYDDDEAEHVSVLAEDELELLIFKLGDKVNEFQSDNNLTLALLIMFSFLERYLIRKPPRITCFTHRF